MPSSRARWLVCLFALSLLCPALLSAQGTTGRIIGRIIDPSGAVLAKVKVSAVNDSTNVSHDTLSNDSGDYAFPDLPVGTYSLTFDLTGFKKTVRHAIALDLNQVITLNMTLQLGATQEVVDVTSEAPLVDTTSTQLGAVMGEQQVSNLPLNSRDTYQLLQLQPGVMSTIGSSNTLIYGSDSPGAVSVNGGRGRANNFSVNGGDANDLFVNLPTVQPTPDSIQEFRVLTNTFDAEYGRNSGSVVNVVTKSGTNDWHGNVYEFFRNKSLNANNYCLTGAEGLPCVKPQFNQNQFGATFGGPIKKNSTFFFVSYEGRRVRQGILSPVVTVPSALERPSPTNLVNGQIVSDFSDINPAGTFAGTLTNSSVLSSRPGCQQATTAIGGGTISDGAPYSSIFPNSQIPLACMDPTAVDLLQFVPQAPNGGSQVTTTPVSAVRGDQFTAKVDHRLTDKQNLSIYYYFNDDNTLSPFDNFELTGADVPGFGSRLAERIQQWNVTHTWTLSNSTVNEFRFNYNREGQETFQHPQNTELVQNACPPAPSWLTAPVPCFYGDGSSDPLGSQFGIHPFLSAAQEGLPFISISGGFSMGNNSEGQLPQVGNSFQLSDNLTTVKGTHTMKAGVDFRRQQFNQFYYYNVNGTFTYYGGGPNDVGANSLYPNYLLGLPDQFGQGAGQVEYVRNTGLYLFAQDSWKIKPNLTLNYGLRWELDTPLADKAHHVQTFRPGQLSSVFPCGGPNTDCTSQNPIGLVVPGDAGVPSGMTQTYYKAFAPRIGLAWSPGTSGKTSFRAGWGLFYNPMEQLVLAQFGAEPPFGGSTFVYETQFNLPFLSQDGSTGYLNPFNGVLNPQRGSQQDWAVFEPMLLFGDFQPNMRTQYSAQYNFTIQRELAHDMKLEIGYVGSQGHRLLATHDINYSNPQTCLDIANIAAANPLNVQDGFGDSVTCGQFLEDAPFVIQPGTVLPNALHLPYAQNNTVIPAGTTVGPNGITLIGLRPYSSPQCNPMNGYDFVNSAFINGCPISGVPVFSSVFAQDTIAGSSYHSLQASLEKRFSHGLQFSAAYTFSKSIDEASSFEGILNPLPNAHNRSLSLFDARHRFVISYLWNVPAPKYTGFMGKLVDGWSLSGITTYQTGFPIRLTSSSDNELMNSYDFELPGEPDQLSRFSRQSPQKNSNYYFNPQAFTENTSDPTCGGNPYAGCYDPSLFGRVGTAPRTICCGPGISETDFALIKLVPVTEKTHFEFRGELFNVFNHTQFFNPDGNSTDGSQFGQVTQVKDPRLMQFALKFYF
ncbi:MAG TPA: carboxypeptidase regulatory-like domain-containing protein [Candidatus Sulfotelmatobacter sp.]|nr:carboxypeptidase regulatory-like domain-containing protein [Candidatus Sulfotelmatobacter sp.]